MAIGIVADPLRDRKLVAPNSPSEIAAANPRPPVSGRRRWGHVISRHARVGDAPSVAAASCSCGSTPRSTGSTARTTNGTATRAWPTGISHHDPRQSTGATSNVISMPNPIVTADVASGSIRPLSSSRPAAPGGGDGERGEHADGDARSPSPRRRAQRRADRGERVDAEPSPGAPRPAEARQPRASTRRRPAATARRAPPAGPRRRRAVADGDADDTHRSRPRVAVAGGPRTQGECPAVPTLLPADQATPAPRPPAAAQRRVAAAPMSPSCVARRQISTSIVAVAGAPSTRMTPNDVNVNRKTIDAGGEDRRPQQRQRDLAERPPRRGAERRRRGLEVGRAGAPTRRRRCARRPPG